MPFVCDICHEESVIEGDRIRREDLGVIEIGRLASTSTKGLPLEVTLMEIKLPSSLSSSISKRE
jgi:hypothetical protein